MPADRRIVQLAEAGCAADIVKVSAGVDVPDEIGAHSGTPYDDLSRAGAALQDAFCRPTIARLPADQIELLRRLDPSAE